jgi:hypothetical protein
MPIFSKVRKSPLSTIPYLTPLKPHHNTDFNPGLSIEK